MAADAFVSRPGSHPNTDGSRLPITAALAMLLLLLAPSVFALMTYQHPMTFLWQRYFSFPIVAAELSVFALTWIAGASPIATYRKLAPATRLAALLFLAAIAISTAVATAQPAIAFGHFAITLVHTLLALGLYGALTSAWRGRERAMLFAAGGGAALFAITVYALLFASRGIADFNWINVGTGVSNLRHLGYFAIVAAGLGAGLDVTAHSQGERTAAWLIFTLGAGLVFWNGGRSGMVALIALLALAIALRWHSRPWRAAAVLGTGLLAGLLLALPWTPPHPAWGISYLVEKIATGSSTLEGFTSSRTLFWRDAWQGFLERPLFGAGEGQFRWLAASANGGFNHPHNALLQALFQWGLLGTAALAWLHVRAFAHGWQAMRACREVAAPALFGLVGTGLVALVDGPLFYVYPTMIWALTLAVLAASGTPEREIEPAAAQPDCR